MLSLTRCKYLLKARTRKKKEKKKKKALNALTFKKSTVCTRSFSDHFGRAKRLSKLALDLNNLANGCLRVSKYHVIKDK